MFTRSRVHVVFICWMLSACSSPAPSEGPGSGGAGTTGGAAGSTGGTLTGGGSGSGGTGLAMGGTGTGGLPMTSGGSNSGGATAANGGGGSGGTGMISGAGSGGASNAGAGSGGAAVGGGGSTGTCDSNAGGTFEERCLACAVDACEQCLCTDCTEELETCNNTAGCPEIAACVKESGCTGLDCYCGTFDALSCAGGQADGPCKSVILAAPGGHMPTPSAGPASDAAVAISACIQPQQPCEAACAAP
jgi:hypothetical protein